MIKRFYDFKSTIQAETPNLRSVNSSELKRGIWNWHQLLPGKYNSAITPREEQESPTDLADHPFNAEYLRRLKSGDRATGLHFESYFKLRLRLKLRCRGLQEADINDIIQDTLLQVLKAVQNDEIRQPAAFGAFVSAICDYKLREKRRRNRFDLDVSELEIRDPGDSLETLLVREEGRRQAKIILNTLLCARDRNLIRAKIFDQLSTEEMCKQFGVSSPSNLRLLLHRARKKFKKACEERGLKS